MKLPPKKSPRNPLTKESFLTGTRQMWTGILLIYSFVIMAVQVMYKIEPSVYINYALTIGSLFILGGSVDSFMKIQAARSIEEKKMDAPSSSMTTTTTRETAGIQQVDEQQ